MSITAGDVPRSPVGQGAHDGPAPGSLRADAHPAGPSGQGQPTPFDEVLGRASGVTVLAFFGLAWTGWGTSALLTGPAQTATVLAALVISLALIQTGWRRYRQAARAAAPVPVSPTDSRAGRNLGRRFGLIVAAEFGVLGIVAAILGATGHPDPIPAVVATGVGIHFFPLARLFSVRMYWLTGAVLCVIGLVTVALAPLTSTPALWTALPGIGSAIVLYATCVQLLRQQSGYLAENPIRSESLEAGH